MPFLKQHRAFLCFARRPNSTADAFVAIRRGAALGVLALAMALVSCDQEKDEAAVQCQRQKAKLVAGATCALVESSALAGDGVIACSMAPTTWATAANLRCSRLPAHGL